MNDDESPREPGHGDDETDREAILRRRSFFVAAAMAGIISSSCAISVDPNGPRADAQPCLSAVFDGQITQPDTGPPPPDAVPLPCLDTVVIDAGPTPCLFVAPDAGD